MDTSVSKTSPFSLEKLKPVHLSGAAPASWPAGSIVREEYTLIICTQSMEREPGGEMRMLLEGITEWRRSAPSPALMKNSWVFLLQPLHLARTLAKQACIIERPKPSASPREQRPAAHLQLGAGTQRHPDSIFHGLDLSSTPYPAWGTSHLSRWLLDRLYGMGRAVRVCVSQGQLI